MTKDLLYAWYVLKLVVIAPEYAGVAVKSSPCRGTMKERMVAARVYGLCGLQLLLFHKGPDVSSQGIVVKELSAYSSMRAQPVTHPDVKCHPIPIFFCKYPAYCPHLEVVKSRTGKDTIADVAQIMVSYQVYPVRLLERRPQPHCCLVCKLYFFAEAIKVIAKKYYPVWIFLFYYLFGLCCLVVHVRYDQGFHTIAILFSTPVLLPPFILSYFPSSI